MKKIEPKYLSRSDGSIVADRPMRFYARGNGNFPMDMLRYDKCYPLLEGCARRLGNWDSKTRAIRLETSGTHVNRGRWKSFGWIISKVEVYNKNKDRVVETIYFDPKTGEMSSVE